ncbi:MAG: MFS transporter [Klebsiella michiganensis]|nr:MFS transporter [Klebsiella michiganensis]
MARFLICSFALVLLYPSGIDMYLVGLPRIAQDLGASEAQLHIAFSVYLAGMAAAMLFAGRIADKSGFIQGIGAGSCYVVAFAVLRDTLDDRRRAKVLSLLNGITCIIPVLAPVLGHLIMLKYPWQSLFYTMTGMGVLVGLLSVFILRETRPTAAPHAAMQQNNVPESLLNRFFLSRIIITTLSVTAILTYVNVSPVIMMEVMGFDRGTYSMAMALMALVSMVVSFSTPFALTLFKPRTLMLTSQVLFFIAGVLLSLSTSQTMTMLGLGLICAGFSAGFGVAMSQALGPFTLRAGVASSVLGIAQVCGSSLWIWLAAIIGLSAMNMLIGILIACSIVSIVLIMVTSPARAAQRYEETPVESRS